MHLIMLFVDGLGVGKEDPAINPLFVARMPVLTALMGGMPSLRHRSLHSARGGVIPLDATLGVKGLPQSGTGQAALLAGFNAPRKAGHHFGPHPPVALRPVIERNNIFRRVLDAGRKACFANAFPQRFFDYARLHQQRLSMTSLSCTMSGVPLRREEDLRAGEAVSADLTGEGWKRFAEHVLPVIAPQESGRRLARLAQHHDFTLFEYWKTDFAGHARSFDESVTVLETFDAMLEGLCEALEGTQTMILLSSDHGNIEDLSIKTHTRNPVPLFLSGPGFKTILRSLAARSRPNLTHVTPLVMEILGS